MGTLEVQNVATGVHVTEWAQEHGRPLTFHAVMDNYEPARRTEVDTAYEYRVTRDDNVERHGIIVCDGVGLFGEGAILLIDDGETVTPWYTVGWSQNPGGWTIYYPMGPGMAIGPRKVYELRVHETQRA